MEDYGPLTCCVKLALLGTCRDQFLGSDKPSQEGALPPILCSGFIQGKKNTMGQIQTKILQPHPNINPKAPGSQKGHSTLHCCTDIGNYGHWASPCTSQQRMHVEEKGEPSYARVTLLSAQAWSTELPFQRLSCCCSTIPVALRVQYSGRGEVDKRFLVIGRFYDITNVRSEQHCMNQREKSGFLLSKLLLFIYK